MKKLLYGVFIIPLIIYGVLCACQDENSSLGSSLVESSFYNVYVDTCTVDISTVLTDSILTRGDTICQLGHYKDTAFGEVYSSYYAEYSTVSFTPNSNYAYTFDSLVLWLVPSGHYWGDTLTQQRISIHQLSYPIVLDYDEDLYNTTVWATDDSVMHTFTFTPQPGKKRSIPVRLPDEWGEALLEELCAEDDCFDSQEKFKKRFPGLVFKPESSGQCITGFAVNDSSMSIKLYYKQHSNQRYDRTLTFTVNTEYAYTGIQHDLTGTPLEGMESGIENLVHSAQLNDRAYIQGLTGFYNQLEFPGINSLGSMGDIVSMEAATLYLYPVRGSYYVTNQLPEDLRLYITDANNVLEDYVYGSDGVTVQTGDLTIDPNGHNTYYAFDLTEFIRNNYGTSGINRQKLLMNLPSTDITTTFNQITFENDITQNNYCKLAIRFKSYNEK